MKRRTLAQTLASMPVAAVPFASAFAPGAVPGLSHPFPGSTLQEEDFHARRLRNFAAEGEKRGDSALRFDIHPGSPRGVMPLVGAMPAAVFLLCRLPGVAGGLHDLASGAR